MEEELNQILSNEELDQAGRIEAIKAFVGKDFVPAKEHKKVKDEWKTKYSSIETEFNQFKQSKMTDEEKQNEYLKQLEESNKAKDLKINRNSIIATFAESGITKTDFSSEEEYETILNSFSKSNEEEAINLTRALCNTMNLQKKNIANKIKEDLIKGQKKPEGGNVEGDEGLTQVEKYKKAYDEAVKNNDRVAMATYTRLISETQNK